MTGTLTADTMGSNYDTVLAVYSGSSVTGLVDLACNDDTGPLSPHGETRQSELSVPVVGGQTYSLQVGGFEAALGDARLQISGPSPVATTVNPIGDFDGDADTDIAVFRPGTGTWYGSSLATTQFGKSDDIPTPGDFDGDSDSDIAVFRPSNGTWYVNGSAAVQFGKSGDIPVPGDYDGDGDTGIAVFRPSNSTWYVSGSPAVQFGKLGDLPAYPQVAINHATGMF